MPLNDLAKNLALNGLDDTAPVVTGITFIGVGNMTDPGTGANYAGTEATGGSPAYARKGVTWAAASAGAKANDAAITLDVPALAGGYGFLLFFNHVSTNSNNYLGYAPINGTVKGFGAVNAADVTANTISSGAHGLSNTNQIQVFNVFAESLPAGTGFTEGAVLFVVGATTDTFQVSLTSGGAAIDLTSVGELFFQKVIPEVFASQGQITVAIGALVLDATTI